MTDLKVNKSHLLYPYQGNINKVRATLHHTSTSVKISEDRVKSRETICNVVSLIE
jgi:hypothetical protein